MTRTIFALGLCILTALPGAGQAQDPDVAAGPRETRFHSLKDNQWVRFSALGLGRRQGQILERSPTELTLSTKREPLRVPATTIDTLWTRGNSAKTGAIAGALIGGALGVGLGVVCGETMDDCNTGEAMLLFGGVGTGGGGLLGALFGSGIPRWHRQYP